MLFDPFANHLVFRRTVLFSTEKQKGHAIFLGNEPKTYHISSQSSHSESSLSRPVGRAQDLGTGNCWFDVPPPPPVNLFPMIDGSYCHKIHSSSNAVHCLGFGFA